MPQTFKHDGVIYEDLGNGNVRVVGYDNAPSAAPQGRVFSLPTDPVKDATSEAQLTKLRAGIAQDVATAPFDRRKAAADATRAEADASIAQTKADEAKATAALATMSANSSVHGDAYLRKYVPPEMWSTVKAYARGDLGSQLGGMSTSMLPIIQHAMNYDPSTSATTFPARAKMQADLAGNQPGTAGGALRAMERMLLHGQEVLAAGQKLNNFGPGILGTLGNKIRTGYEHLADNPTLNGYEQLVKNYAPEAQKAIAQTSGGQAERQDRAESFSGASSQASRVAALQADARQAFDAMGAVNDQYKRLMGRDILNQMSPAAKAAYDRIMSGGYDDKGHALHPADGYVPGSVFGDDDVLNGPHNGPGGGSGGGGGGGNGPTPIGPLATGSTKLDRNPERERALDALLRSGASNDTINATSKAMGGMDIEGAKLDAMREAVRKGYKGPTFDSSVAAPTTLWNRLSASPIASAVIGAGNGLTGGAADEVLGGIDSLVTGRPLSESIAAIDDRKQALANENWKSSLAGNAAGSLVGLMGLGAGARAAGMTAALGKYTPYAGAAAYGGLTGALENNKDRLGGAALGTVAGIGGQAAGDLLSIPVGAVARSQPVQRVLGLFGQQRAVAPALAPADAMVVNAATKAGVGDIRSQLSEAQNLGLPMTLADTHPELRELAGAAVRRSPAASSLAENALLPRNRGQIDRLSQAVTRDLGPTANIPQLAADMTDQARAAAGPLYDRAYAQPVVSTPEIQSTLNTPFGRQALSRANTIAANERRNPMELGFAQDEAGNVVLNPRPNQAIANHLAARAELDAAQEAYRVAKNQPGSMDAARNRLTAARDGLRKAEFALNQAPDPSLPANVPGYTTQTLDYVKRGMDDVLEQQRNPITGRLVLDEAGRAQNQVRSQFLNEVDRINPAYGVARNAYAGPVQARDALARGQHAFSLNPDELAMQVGTQSPEHLAQMQLGYRDQLMKEANNVRFSTNPYEATLGTPAAEQRLSTLYGDTPGVSQLLRQRDLERSMQQTSNGVLGNSKTPQRQIADEGFLENPAMQAGVDIGANVLAGGMPVTTMLRALAGNGVRDAIKLGIGKQAVAKADAVAPTLLNLNPGQNLSKLDELLAAQDAYQQMVMGSRPKRLGMMFSGASVGAANQLGR